MVTDFFDEPAASAFKLEAITSFVFLAAVTCLCNVATFTLVLTYLLTYILTYLLTYLLHGAASFLRS